MPRYSDRLRVFSATIPSFLSNTIHHACHDKLLFSRRFFAFSLILSLSALLPEFCRAQDAPAASADSASEDLIERPDFSVHVARPNAPKDKKNIPYIADFRVQKDKHVYHLSGKVVFEMPEATLRADEADYDEEAGVATATGNVYYRDYEHDEVVYADTATYNTDTEIGEFHHVRGYNKAKIVARPGVLTSRDPFYFEADWVERLPGKYLLHDAFMTDCEMPNPWWTINSDLIDFIPHERAITHNAVYRLRGLPVFYFPYFHKSLRTEPRQSGFLTPNVGHSSTRGFLFGLGYYQTMGRSMDVTYVIQDFTSRGYAHQIDFRGRPTQKSDFNINFYGVQDRGIKQGANLLKAPGFSLTGAGRVEFGNGWVARGSLDYLSSYLFHQQFTDSFTQAIFSETHSVAFVEKHFGTATFDVSASRTENFLDTTAGNSVEIRALPEAEFHDNFTPILSGKVPLWFSLNSSWGYFHRVEPKPVGQPDPGFYQTSQFSSRGDFEPTLTSAFHFGGFSFVPEATAHEVYYGQTLVSGAVTNHSLARSAPELKADLIFPSLARVFNKKTIFGDKLKHVIEPRARIDYVGGVSQFGNTLLFDSTDLLTNTKEAEFGITNRFYSKRGDNVTEIFTWDLSQKHYFDPTFGGALTPGQRNVFATELNLTGYTYLDGVRRNSPIVSSMSTSPINGLHLVWQADYDPTVRRIVNSSVSANVRFHQRYFVNAGSDQIRPNSVLAPPSNQFRATFGYGDANRKGFNTAFSMVYDYRLGLLEYGIAQVTYNTSCCGISVQVRRLDFGTVVENQYLASFSIANVASLGTLKKQERIF